MPVVAVLALAGVPGAIAKPKPRHRTKHKSTRSLQNVSGGAGAAVGGSAAATATCPTRASSQPSPASTTSGTTTGAAAPGTTTTGTSTGTSAQSGTTAPPTAGSGGAGLGQPTPVPCTPARPTVPGYIAKIIDGVAYAPSEAPASVQRAIWAGNRIRLKPYIWGGGHGSFRAAGYDCSGAVSYVLHAAGILSTPMDSSDLMGWGARGVGGWITVYTNFGHAFIEIAGIRFDTSAEADPNPPSGSGPRWRPLYPNPPGFMARHPLGY